MQDSLADVVDYAQLVTARDADRLAFSLEKFARAKITEPELHSLLRRLATACRDFHSHATQILASAPPKIREAIARSIP